MHRLAINKNEVCNDFIDSDEKLTELKRKLGNKTPTEIVNLWQKMGIGNCTTIKNTTMQVFMYTCIISTGEKFGG